MTRGWTRTGWLADFSVVVLVTLTGLDGQKIDVNPQTIVSVRTPHDETTLTKDVKCLLTTVDGKGISVIDTCDEVRAKLDAGR